MSPRCNTSSDNFKMLYAAASGQEQAVINNITGAVNVIVSGGTNTATILALRTAKILLETSARPENILCFVKSGFAITLLKKQLEQLIGTDATKINIHTFQSFYKFLLTHNNNFIESNSPVIISALENIQLFKQLIDGFPKSQPLKRFRSDVYDEMNSLQKLFLIMKREGFTAEILNKKINILIAEISARDELSIYKEKDLIEKLRSGISQFNIYQNLLQSNNRYDRTDEINSIVKALEQNENLLNSYRQQFQYIQVENYDATGNTDKRLLSLLTKGNEAPGLLLINYRGNATLLNETAIANSRHWKTLLLTGSNLAANGEKPLKQTCDGRATAIIPTEDLNNIILTDQVKNTISVTSNASLTDEVAGITEKINELLQQVIPPKITVVYRDSIYKEALQDFFNLNNLAFFSREQVDILQHPLIQKIILLLRYTSTERTSPHSGDALLFEILCLDLYKAPPAEIVRLVTDAGRKKTGNIPLTIRRLLKERANAPAKDLFDTGLDQELRNISSLVENLVEAAAFTNLHQLLEMIIRDASITRYVMQHDEGAWLTQLLEALKDFICDETNRNPAMQLHEFINLIGIMERQQVPIWVTRQIGKPGNVCLVGANEIEVATVDSLFITGANTPTHKNDGWLNYLYRLPGVDLVTYNDFKKDQDDLDYLATFGSSINLYISFVENITDRSIFPQNKWMENFILKHSIPIIKARISNGSTLLDRLKNKPQIAALPNDLVVPVVNKFVMSASALNTYLDCPLAFYYKIILKVPHAKNEALEFGSAVHYALENFFKKMSARNELTGIALHNHFPPASELTTDFNWYMVSQQHCFTQEAFSRRLQYGQEVLQNYYDQYVNSWNKIVSVERNIRVTLDGIPLKGKLDKLEFNGKEVTIVDYKSGDVENAISKMMPPGEANPTGGDYWRQSVFYKILIDNYEQKDWTVTGVVFDFIEPGKNGYHKEKIPIGPADIETVKQQVTAVGKKIQAHDFYTGCGEKNCHWCNFVIDNQLAIAMH